MKHWRTLFIAGILWSAHRVDCAEPAYRVAFTGEMKRALRDSLKQASLGVGLRTAGSVTPRLLRQRAQKDLDHFAVILRDRGFYGFEQRFELSRDPKGDLLTFHIHPGPVYTLGGITVEGAPVPGPAFARPDNVSAHARSAEINRVGKEAVAELKNAGYPWAALTHTRIIPDHPRKQVDVVFVVSPGARARFGALQLSGLKRVSSDYIRSKAPVDSGAWYREDHLQAIRKRLVGSGLFNQVLVKPAPEAAADGRVDVLVELHERRFRTLFAGVSYQSDRGAGATGGFEHANVLHRGERASTELSVDEVNLSWKNRVSKPDFLAEDQSLILKLDFVREDTDAYRSSSTTTGAALDRKLGEKNRGGIGAELRSSKVTQAGVDREFLLYLFPLELERNTSNDLLDPTGGYRVKWQGAPYFNVHAEDVFFLKNRLSWRQYVGLHETGNLTLAGRLALGTISGSALLDVPADERFYAGGGGSLRGYAFQSAGTLDEAGNPVGGRSLFEASLELRGRIYGDVGMTLFWDMGGAGDSVLPAERGSLFHGVGAGLRYHTPIGPIRADVGFPLDRRAGIDKRAQFYLSIGQAF